MPARVGIYSGAFNPVHNGHIAFALTAARQCKLDTVVFVPEPQPRHKQGIVPLQHRVAMLQLAFADHANLTVLELAQQPQFTVAQTLPVLRDRFGGADLYVLMGSDVATSLPSWPDADTMLNQTTIIVGLRHTDTEAAVRKACGSPVNSAKLDSKLIFVVAEHADASSRQAHATGFRTDIDSKVAAYIATHQLYAFKD